MKAADPGEALVLPLSRIRLAARALRICWHAAPYSLLTTIVTQVGLAITPVVGTWGTKSLVDAIAARRSPVPAVVVLVTASLLFALLPPVVAYLRDEMERRVGLAAKVELTRAVGRLVGLGRHESPAFVNRLALATTASTTAPLKLVSALLAIGASVLTIAGYLATTVALAPLLGGVAVVGMVPVLVGRLWLGNLTSLSTIRLSPAQRRETFFGQLLINVRAAKENRLFGIGDWLLEKMIGELATINAERRSLARREHLTETLLALLNVTIAAAGLIWATQQAQAGQLTAGKVVALTQGLVGLQSSVGGAIGRVGEVHIGLIDTGHYVGVVDAEPDLPVRDPALGTPPAVPGERGLVVDDVWFRYAPDQPWVLQGLSLTIPPGAAIGLVGVNGAGKSTLVKLLCRFYDPVHGAIRWNGVDVRHLDPAELRARIGAVFQDFMNYDLTAGENILLGDLSASSDRRDLAARRAGIHDAITRLADGFDTQLSSMAWLGEEERGVSLSGGQWQRLALARALLRENCELIILDEPSSGLDPQAEQEIHAELVGHRQGRTSLLISHRLSAVREADLVVVLDNGTTAEIGTHDQLMALGGRYAAMFTAQASGYGEQLPLPASVVNGRAARGSDQDDAPEPRGSGWPNPGGRTLALVDRHGSTPTPTPNPRPGRNLTPGPGLTPTPEPSWAGGEPEASDLEGQLLVRVGRGDRAAFGELYGRAAPLVFGTIVHLLPPAAQAEQVTLDILVEVWRKAAWFDPERHSGRAWLVAMARQCAMERARFLAPRHESDGGGVNGVQLLTAPSAQILPRG